MNHDDLQKDITNADDWNREALTSMANGLATALSRVTGLLYLNIALTVGLIGALALGVI